MQYHQLSGREFEQTPGDSEGEAWCAAINGVAKESDMAEQLN